LSHGSEENKEREQTLYMAQESSAGQLADLGPVWDGL
jgi:hypothetical protein